MKRRTFLAASAATLALVSTTALAQAPRAITITHSSPASSHFGLAAITFKEVVEKESGGRFKVTIQRLDNEREALESVQLGSQEFSMGSTGPVGNFVPAVRALDVPFLFRDYAHARGVVDGPIGQAMLKEFNRRNIVGLAFLENGFRHLTTGGKLVEKPEDVKGLKIRTMENPVHMSAWRAAGVLPTPMAFSELPPALQQGTVDGQENPIPIILSNNFNQLQKYLYLTGHVYSAGLLAGSQSFWSTLSEADRVIFMKAAKAAVQTNRDKVEADERDGVAELRKRGMDVREVANRAAYQEAMKAAMPDFEKQFGADLLRQIREWK
ncbi:DctP family TRAP transporter solute-binding subunit [Rhabdaerophilum sp.]|uniref:DctP family TRAP transporter solute-binding subunit n=1 Tax=Rhabdaerophilum sp. TaxID=2717341 RepID=UPI0038D3890B